MNDIIEDIKERQAEVNKINKIESLIISVPTCSIDQIGEDVMKIFESTPEAEGVVVLDGRKPVGLIMKTFFYQKIGTLYGHSLFLKRSVKGIMDNEITVMSCEADISYVGLQAMDRTQNKLYDYIIVHSEGEYIGVVSIRLFLISLSNMREKQIEVLNRQQEELIRYNETEHNLRVNLKETSEAVKNLLDNAGQGFLSFGKDLIVKEGYSSECMKIFGQAIGGKNYYEILNPYLSPENAGVISLVLDSYFASENEMRDKAYLNLMPNECGIFNHTYHFECKRVIVAEQKTVMVIITDVTEKKAMEKMVEAERKKQHLVIKAITNKTQINDLINSFTEFTLTGWKSVLSSPDADKEKYDCAFRAVHTFKGDFAQYGFISTSLCINEFEDRLDKLRGGTDMISKLTEILSELDAESIMVEDTETLKGILGDSFFGESQDIVVPYKLLTEMEDYVKSMAEVPQKHVLLRSIKNLKSQNVKIFISQYEDYMVYLADRLMKIPPVFLVEGDDVMVEEEKYKDLFKSLVHIFRNIMQHGIETDEERLMIGKSEIGEIKTVVTANVENTFTLRISDDGAGIDLQKIRDKAVSTSLFTQEQIDGMSQEDIINIIFIDGFSTKDKANELAGRGVGMSSVKNECEKLGGKIKVETSEGKGTDFIITVPSGQ